MLPCAIESCKQPGSEIAVEVIVIDDGSTDNTEATISGHDVKYIKLPKNVGRCEARNEGMRQSSGCYLKFLDSDDRLEPGALVLEVELARSTDADIVVSAWRETRTNDDGSETEVKVGKAPVMESILDDLLAGKGVPTSAALYRRVLTENIAWLKRNRFDDWDFFVQAALQATLIKSLPRPSYNWRHHSGARATDAGMLATSLAFYEVLARMRRALESRDQFTPARRRRYAQYLYKEVRSLYRWAPEEGRRVLAEIRRLDPRFKPVDEEHSAVIRALTNIMPVAWVLEGYGTLRSLVDRVTLNRGG